jgi:hypothetical protein
MSPSQEARARKVCRKNDTAWEASLDEPLSSSVYKIDGILASPERMSLLRDDLPYKVHSGATKNNYDLRPFAPPGRE